MPCHIKALFMYAKTFLDKESTFWDTKIKFFFHNDVQMSWQKRGKALLPKNTIPTVKHEDGNIMLWGCFCSNGTGNLVRISTMEAENYITILSKNLKVSTIDIWLGCLFFFQEDNNPKLKSKSVTAWLKRTKLLFLAGLPRASI